MAKRYTVTPRVPPGRTKLIATFYNSAGERITRSLETDNHARAGTLCADLVTLWTGRIDSVVKALALNVDPLCIKLYFSVNQNADEAGSVSLSDISGRILAQAHAEALDYPKEARARLRPILADRVRLKEENEALHVQLGQTQRLYAAEKTAREAMERTAIARAVKTAARAPSMDDAAAEFEKHIRSKTNKSNAAQHVNAWAKFRATLPPDLDNVANITVEQVGAFLDARAADGDPARQVGRRRAWHLMIARFFSFLQERYALPSLMPAIPFPGKNDVERERGDIEWHTLKDVQKAMNSLPDAYWRALVGCLAYAGLQLAEVCWLRVQDLKLSKNRKRARLWVTTVEEDGERHAIKTENRRRGVDVHPALMPLLVKHLDEGRAGKKFLFPMRRALKKNPKENESAQRKRRGLALDDERWRVSSLSTVLRGHNGGEKRKVTAALLPKRMNAKSLRRTFGSLLLRAGKSTAQVAAAMGNSERVVQQHYARILAAEVNVNF
jgi:hypothetical protein